MRRAFFDTVTDMAQECDDIYLLTGDLGFGLFDEFRSKYSERFFDIGVAEANMIGIAAGLALSDKNVYCYSIIPFLIMRTFEQIRIDIAYQNLNVKLVGTGGGFTYGLEGFTHFGLEDLALMRTLPNITIVVPADPLEAKCLAKISYEYRSPMYIRLGKTGEPRVHNSEPDFRIGKPIFLSEGSDIALFAIGSMVYVGKQVVERLKKSGVKTTLINMHTLKPFNRNIVCQVASAHQVIFSLEEHYTEGGLGSSIAEVIAEKGDGGIFRRIGVDKLNRFVGDSDFLREKYGLTVDKVYDRILKEMKRN
ncbi:MAG: transketolase C-terminal domain-containing protein [Candidatus Edwardsbacteria bacterium]